MKIDTHTHLLSTKQSTPDLKHIDFFFYVARSFGLDAVCYTEHLDADCYLELLDYIFVKNGLDAEIIQDGIAKLPNSLLISSGAEVSLSNGSDVGLHASPKVLKRLNRTKGYYNLETLTDAVSCMTSDFIIVAHHLYWPNKWLDEIEEQSELLDAIELPAKDFKNHIKYNELSKDLQKPLIAGSDAHTWVQLAVGHTILDHDALGANDFDKRTLKQAIKNNKINAQIEPGAGKVISLSKMYREYFAT